MSYTHINVDLIVQMARSHGLPKKREEEFRTALEEKNARPSMLLDHPLGKQAKILDRMEGKEVLSVIQNATDLLLRCMLGQWWYVRGILDAYASPEVVDDLPEDNRRDIQHPPKWGQVYAAHKAVCVAACTCSDCDQRECWETRRWGCEDQSEGK